MSNSNAVYVVALIIGVATLGRGIFVGENVAVEALEKSGYSDVQITSSGWFFVGMRGCSEKDAAKFVATATNVNGDRVEDIIICSGWPFKGATVRF